ncbi:MAG: hypothetical protein JO171_13695 [Paludibacterium sp.]|uniref:hypothetical protein n=1 Tax=Paludibacterium sp. TaxID=1917523 RepID=UPI0025D6DD83|nr:hypothetical protein [Paludibacterium sp.]MBV8048208.1 hypothetical protein [Paludibacterium sp.]MBV8648965.1 hypothetical protein [Paludibacterium sp.]
MKRILLPAALWLFCLGALAAPTLTLLPIIESSPNLPTASASDTYTQAFADVHRFSLAATGNLANTLDRLKQLPAGLLNADPRALADLGKQAGAQIVAVGRVRGSETTLQLDEDRSANNTHATTYATVLMLEVRLIDVQTGAVIKNLFFNARNFSVKKDDCLDDSFSDLQDDLTKELQTIYPLQGHIVQASGNSEYMIDIGSASELKSGSHMLIFEDGAPIPDPSTGKLLMGDQTVLGEGVITHVAHDSAVLKVSHLNGTIEAGKTKVEAAPKEAGFWSSMVKKIL